MPRRYKRKRKKVILHQTRDRMERLVRERSAADPNTEYSASQLDGYEALFSIIYRRTGELPGLDRELVDLPLVYSEQIHHRLTPGEALQECRQAGLTIKERFGSTLLRTPLWRR